jgi:hypothetical protein
MRMYTGERMRDEGMRMKDERMREDVLHLYIQEREEEE